LVTSFSRGGVESIIHDVNDLRGKCDTRVPTWLLGMHLANSFFPSRLIVFFGLKGKIHLQKSKTSCIGIGTTNNFREMGFISQVLQVVSRKGFNLFLLGNNIRGFVTWHSSLWALSEPLMISTALAGTREKQKQMKMKVSRNVEI